jgi:hypothetical protein
VVALDSIVGKLEPTVNFDARFRPVSDVVRWRWERVALAHRRGIALAPIQLRRRSDGYYVVDGRHRVSVALALGHRDIDAWVTSDRTSRARLSLVENLGAHESAADAAPERKQMREVSCMRCAGEA